MSGTLESIIDTVSRLGARRAEARVRAQLRKAGQGLNWRGLSHVPPAGFGDFTAARAALKGELRIGGWRHRISGLTPWDIELPAPSLVRSLHGFAWLDDMAALATKQARHRAQGWTAGWLDRYGDGAGPGWGPLATADRLARLAGHLAFLEKGFAPDLAARLHASLPVQTAFLFDTWAEETETLPRLAALSGLIGAMLCIGGFATRVSGPLATLGAELRDRVSSEGEIAGRNPSDLLDLLQRLIRLRDLMEAAGQDPPPALAEAIARIAPALRVLRLGDGSLPRFNGGWAGPEGALDHALADSGHRARPGDGPAMGYVRLHAWRTVLIVDTGRPPLGSDSAHAGTLGFEMSSGRRPVLVNCGPAIDWMPDAQRLPRTTAAHNTLTLDKTSSSRFAPPRTAGRAGLDRLQTRPSMVTLARAQDATGSWIQTRHDGYLEDYGLIHERRLFLSASGGEVHGEDVLLSPDQKAQKRFQNRIRGAARLGVQLSLHFHLHPSVSATPDGAGGIRLDLPSGEAWVFHQKGGEAELQSSQYFDPSRPDPVPTRQIVVLTRTVKPSADLSWSFRRLDVAGRATRDLSVDAPDG